MIEVNGARLDFDLTGDDGPLVVQLHGLTSSRSRDAQLGLDLGRALRGHRILRLDARGHGGSSGTADPADYTWDRLADDLLAALDVIAPSSPNILLAAVNVPSGLMPIGSSLWMLSISRTIVSGIS